jgi:Xaa-Pro aminopeptidase
MFPWPTVDRTVLRAHRRERAAALMGERRLDHLLLTGFDTIRYVTDVRTQLIAEGFDWFAVVVDRDGSTDTFVPWVDEVVSDPDPELPHVRAAHPLTSWTPLHPHRAFWVRTVAGVLRERGARRVGFDLLYADILDGLRGELGGVEFVPLAVELQELRAVKHPLEIELLAAASLVNSRAAQDALDAARPGMRDHDILAVAMRALQEAGVEYLTHSLCNLHRGSGTWFAVGNELREGDAFFFDIGCLGAGGYASDLARTGFVGEPRPEVRAAYADLLEALAVGEATARPGVKSSVVHETVNRFLRERGRPITPYSMGHGVGLRACELPTIHRADRMDRDDVIREGMVIAIEPETGVEVDGRLVLLKVEENYLVEAGGLRKLTTGRHGAVGATA